MYAGLAHNPSSAYMIDRERSIMSCPEACILAATRKITSRPSLALLSYISRKAKEGGGEWVGTAKWRCCDGEETNGKRANWERCDGC